jgi:hypothetical protein
MPSVAGKPIMLSVIMLSLFMLNIIMLSVVAPYGKLVLLSLPTIPPKPNICGQRQGK